MYSNSPSISAFFSSVCNQLMSCCRRSILGSQSNYARLLWNQTAIPLATDRDFWKKVDTYPPNDVLGKNILTHRESGKVRSRDGSLKISSMELKFVSLMSDSLLQRTQDFINQTQSYFGKREEVERYENSRLLSSNMFFTLLVNHDLYKKMRTFAGRELRVISIGCFDSREVYVLSIIAEVLNIQLVYYGFDTNKEIIDFNNKNFANYLANNSKQKIVFKHYDGNMFIENWHGENFDLALFLHPNLTSSDQKFGFIKMLSSVNEIMKKDNVVLLSLYHASEALLFKKVFPEINLCENNQFMGEALYCDQRNSGEWYTPFAFSCVGKANEFIRPNVGEALQPVKPPQFVAQF